MLDQHTFFQCTVIMAEKKKRLTTKQKQFLKIYSNNVGNVSLACEKMGIARGTYYNWYKGNEKFAEAIDDIEEERLDFAESKLMQNIADGKEASIFFFLKTKGKERGFIEKQELSHEERNPFMELMKNATKKSK